MKQFACLFTCILFFQSQARIPISTKAKMIPIKIKLTIGANTFTASLANNKTVHAFKSKLPFELKMIELNGNEKYTELDSPLPTNASNPGRISIGDILLYGDQTLVVFYKSFSTPYSYSNIGKIDDVTGLALALGSGNISVKFELVK
ncbi:MAG: hypothetical protein CFE25_04455 [Chitinophagaceae bacterium BSSC1]|nr:MAG: hypothetical protein CFE25_04455 [Chitinophagaceae bacterium BSSC1]